jgi:hypothetical protein
MTALSDSPERGKQVPDRAKGLAWQTIDGEVALLDLKGKVLLGLNAVGGLVWELSDGAHSVEQIAQRVAEEFDVSAETARADVSGFIEELIARGALTLRS